MYERDTEGKLGKQHKSRLEFVELRTIWRFPDEIEIEFQFCSGCLKDICVEGKSEKDGVSI